MGASASGVLIVVLIDKMNASRTQLSTEDRSMSCGALTSTTDMPSTASFTSVTSATWPQMDGSSLQGMTVVGP